jgi:hypothetical protein
MKDEIQITLSKDEALVLFEFLSRFVDDSKLEIADPSENRVLWDLQASLESLLAEPFSKDYDVILESARKRFQ